jgi:hydroxypyruvate reductase
MTQAVNDTLADLVSGGICVCPAQENTQLPDRYELFHGGHPLPNEISLLAAEATFRLLDRANAEEATVIFAISGGGSAMIEMPSRPDISLADLRLTNQILVSCGARISEINVIRQAISEVKGGKLLRRIPNAQAISLIISDTNEGDEASVASGPTLAPPDARDSARDLVYAYRLEKDLPVSVLSAIERSLQTPAIEGHAYFVLASNKTALEAARRKAESLGFESSIEKTISEQPIAEGCEMMQAKEGPNTCVLSGGEFSCPVRGNGLGGRNSETALRCAISLDPTKETVVLSAGTDGIDGNSPAAGAIADNTTMARAHSLGLDEHDFLARSDSHRFFTLLKDAIYTGPTGTNVRDVRMVLSGS